MQDQTNYKEGDLVRFKSNKGWDICVPTDINGRYGKQVKEYVMSSIPLDFYDVFTSLEENLGLIVKVVRNKLEQPYGYRVQIGQDVLFFKYVLAQKYFEPVEGAPDESRRTRSV